MMSLFKLINSVQERWQFCKDFFYSKRSFIKLIYPDLDAKISSVMGIYLGKRDGGIPDEFKYAILNHNIVASVIAKVSCETSGQQENIVIKFLMGRSRKETYKHRLLIKKEYDTLKKVYNHGPTEYCSVIEPLLLIENHLALISRYVRGIRLDDLFLGRTSFSLSNTLAQLEESLYHVGQWLDFFSRFTAVAKNAEQYIEQKREEIEVLAQEVLADGYMCQQFSDKLSVLKNKIEFNDKFFSICHGDFIPSNLILTEDRVYVTDFADQYEGLTFEDLAKFFQWFEYYRDRRPWVQDKDIDKLQRAFLKGFSKSFDLRDPLFIFFRVYEILQNLKSLRRKNSQQRLMNNFQKLIDKRRKKMMILMDMDV